KRHWLDRSEFLNGVALGQTMPGPLAAQVAMWVGYLQAAGWGALAIALTFILPSFSHCLAVAYLYVHLRGLTVIQSLFYGIAPAVMAIIAFAARKLARLTNQRDLRLWAISVVILTVTALTGTEVALLFLGAGFLMILLDAPPKWIRGRGVSSIIAAPAGFSLLTGTATSATMLALGLFFLKAGAFIFGSGLAIVPFLREAVRAIAGATVVLTRQAVVDVRTALILALALVFVWRLKGMEPLLVILAGAAGILMKGL